MVGREKEGKGGAPFVVKTYQLVSDPSTDELVTWSPTRDSFVVVRPVEFAHEVLPRYFKHNNFCSFIRQLNTYGFHKVEGKQWEFKHELFQQNQPHMLSQIKRRKSQKREAEPATPDSFTTSPAISPPILQFPQPIVVPNQPINLEVKEEDDKNFAGNFQDDEEVDKLRNLNTLLMKEVIRLQQQQETTQGTIKQILDELIESRKEQKKLQDQFQTLANGFNPPKKSRINEPERSPQLSSPNSDGAAPAEDLETLEDLNQLDLGLEFNIANFLHITPPASPAHHPQSPQISPFSPYLLHSLSPPLSPQHPGPYPNQ